MLGKFGGFLQNQFAQRRVNINRAQRKRVNMKFATAITDQHRPRRAHIRFVLRMTFRGTILGRRIMLT